jgi:hypothetical protein
MAARCGYPSPVLAQPAEGRTHRNLCQFVLDLLAETDALVAATARE